MLFVPILLFSLYAFTVEGYYTDSGCSKDQKAFFQQAFSNAFSLIHATIGAVTTPSAEEIQLLDWLFGPSEIRTHKSVEGNYTYGNLLQTC